MCNIERYKKEAIEKNMVFLGKGTKKKYYLYKFKDCDHTREIIPSKLKNDYTPICRECSFETFKKEALNRGLKLIGDSLKNGYYTYQFIKCGHKKEYEPKKLRIDGKRTCDVCLINRFKKDANKKGLVLIGESKRRGYYKYKFKECGHTKESRPDMVNIGNPCCELCGDTYHSKKSKIYLMEIFSQSKSFLKLGVAGNSKSRIRTYGLKAGYKAKVLKEIPFDTNFDAVRVEKTIHKKYKAHNLDHNTIKPIMESGYTECYPLEIVNKLLSELR